LEIARGVLEKKNEALEAQVKVGSLKLKEIYQF
jgi:hypothetical protein